eukprot:COSAG02_NODE_2486_length_8709_cov_5.616725_5_plen_96_part_00
MMHVDIDMLFFACNVDLYRRLAHQFDSPAISQKAPVRFPPGPTWLLEKSHNSHEKLTAVVRARERAAARAGERARARGRLDHLRAPALLSSSPAA